MFNQFKSRAFVVGSALGLVAGLGSTQPLPVSPGAEGTATLVSGLCLTFDIAPSGLHSSHEIAVYALGPDGNDEPSLAQQVRLPTGATGWTPSADDCLDPEHHYAWAVREAREKGSGEWSRVFYFRTPSADLTDAQVEAVNVRVREVLQSTSTDSHDAGSQAQLSTGSSSVEGGSPALATSKAGIRSVPSETTGEVAGVIGVSRSPDGAGVIAANTNPGAPDLVLEGQLHGAEDTHLTESGIDVGGNTFNITGPEGLSVLIAGSEAVTTETISQHDTLSQLACATDQVAQWNGSHWVCTTLTLSNIEIPIPDAPQYVRVVPNYLDPPTKRLAWSMEDLTGVGNFIVYQSPSPITEANKHLAIRRFTNEMWVPFSVIPDSGLMHLRVEAVNLRGEASELSMQYRLNSAVRLQFSTQNPDVGYLSRPNGDLTSFDSAAWSPGGSRYAYFDQDGVFVANESGPTALVVPAAGGEYFVWSPDDFHLGYVTDLGSTFLTDREGSSLVEIPGMAIWSPRGDTVAYWDESLTTLYVRRLGEPSVQVMDGVSSQIAWSPDGKHLGYMKINDDGYADLWVTDAVGVLSQNVTADLNDGIIHFQWSPDGSRLAFVAFDSSSGFRTLYICAANGASRIAISPPSSGAGVMAFQHIVFSEPFPWSPDSKYIAYLSDHETPSQYAVFIGSAFGGDAIRVSDPYAYPDYATPSWLSWSPDGSHLGYVVDLKWEETPELFLWSNASGSNSRVHGVIPKKEKIGFFFGTPAFSPDSRFISYYHWREGGVLDVYSTPTDGGTPVKLNPDGTVSEFFDFKWVRQGWPLGSF